MKKKVLGFSLAVLALAGYVLFDEIKWATYEFLIKQDVLKIVDTKEDLTKSDEIGPIAHAGGKIGDWTYTNSKEALYSALDQGYRFIELDLRKTLDGKYFAAHKIKEFNALTGNSYRFLIPPTSSSVRESKINGQLTPLLLSDVAEILKKYPDVFLVTDKARDFKALVQEFSNTDRLIVEVSDLGQYYDALKSGVKYPVMQCSDYAKAQKYQVNRVVVSNNVAMTQNASRYLENGGHIFVASFPKLSDVEPRFHRKGVLVYVDEK